VKWWNWLVSIPKAVNPSFDSDGRYAFANQSDPNVIFLCQTIESSTPTQSRTVTIPHGKCIFLPIINYISTVPENGNTDDEIMIDAKNKINRVSNLEFYVNDQKLDKDLNAYRFLSPFFNAYFSQDNVLSISRGIHRCISDGYWIMFQPGKDFLKFSTFGSCSSGATKITVSYKVFITR
jgi:hypothetical protein